MAVVLEATIKRFRAFSWDAKPLLPDEGEPPIPVGSTLTEKDTGDRYVWTPTGQWELQAQTIETMFSELMDINRAMLVVLRATHRGHEEHDWEDEVEIEETL